jgi:PAS domain S-box-containing protein
MGEYIRAFDWASTPLGPISGWPQCLRTALGLCLKSRFPTTVIWGPHFIFLYNDALIPVMGSKHPSSLGRPAYECYAEIWPLVGPLLRTVHATGEATWSADMLVVVDRNGYLEETYETFSYIPIVLESGEVGGCFEVTMETTEQVIGARRLRTLHDLASRGSEAKTIEEACSVTTDVLATNCHDIPFALVYLMEGDRERARLVTTAGLAPGTPASPSRVDLTCVESGRASWPLRQAADSGKALRVDALAERFGSLPRGPWDVSPQSALLLPISMPSQQMPMGILVAAVSPRRALDSQYRTFFDLLAAQVSSNFAGVRAHEEDRRRVQALAEIDRVKTAFFSNVSHEFRTPLTLVLGHIEDVLARQSTALDPKDLGVLEVARRSALRLQKLVHSLLDFSRIEAGRMQAAYEPVDLASLTTDLASVFRSAIERAGMRLVVDCPPLMEPVYVDREMWETIVLNLLSNAFKYTFEGEIRVALRQLGAAVEFSVSDSGIGIPAQELPRIFERFHRFEGACGRSQEGTGIGLALVQELVKLHGGSARVESVHGRGSTLTVTVPLGKDHLPAEHIGGTPTAASKGTGTGAYVEEALRWLPPELDEATGRCRDEATPIETSATVSSSLGSGVDRARILLADDNADMRAYVRNLLGEFYEVTAVADGEAALAEVRRHLHDLLISDVMMPRLDGFGLLKAVRSDPAASLMPVILLSARAGGESSVEGLERGADDYLVKPFSARELMARVAAVLALARLRKEAAERRSLTAVLEETKRLNDQLAFSEWRLQLIANSLPALIAHVDRDQRYDFANQAYKDWFGLEPQQVLGRPIRQVLGEELYRSVLPYIERALAGERVSFTTETITEGGPSRSLDAIYVPDRDDLGKVRGFYALVLDVTDRVRAQQEARRLLYELAHADRMSMMGELAATLAHEVNQPLAAILTNAQAAQRFLNGPSPNLDEVREIVGDIADDGARAGEVIRRMRTLVKKERAGFQSLDVNQVLHEVVGLLRHDALIHKVTIELHLDPNLPAVNGDRIQLQQVAMNLLLNAFAAIEEGSPKKRTVQIESHRCDSEVQVTVRDHGPGIPRETLERLFEPFNSSKPQGLGLGLSISRSIVGVHGGRIWVQNNSDGGATFSFALPVLVPAPSGGARHERAVTNGVRGR